ncbi:Predicted small molecule binding protein (contains 3H domain) [Staphylococcus piscifermentans]|uniref:Transcriptional regulator n=1 Tax=Staphylococcus piscifermentans TaxID=70258 RepID=A0A239TYD6_9STAP|nr:transcription repressor NadR [Staphylococcus piscifermentans]RTX84727.1 transcription repressor NadR [Staphylococcus piscifermentans]GEP85639.1 transcriptional regulator [Staphylococcus piscifermentans]SNV02730.1 Predicted small molecule binding protein (contains 3H domain) [Staphylococcus piscifermentans]
MSQADERRAEIVELLKMTNEPIKGSELSQRFGVSRQIIVKDISHLKTRDYAIKSTSKGYFLNIEPQGKTHKRLVMCQHDFDEMEAELSIIVENGAMIDDVSVEHPVYGNIRAELMIETPEDIQVFIEEMTKFKGTMLAQLTDGIHLHTLSADTEKILENAVEDLERQGFIVGTEEPTK